MLKIFVATFALLFLLSCQTTPKQDKIQAETPTPVLVVKGAKPEESDLTGTQKTGEEDKKGQAVQSIEKPVEKKVLSSCPAGLNGRFVGKIEDGLYCFSRPKDNGCYQGKEPMVLETAKNHCENYQSRLLQAGVWNKKRDSHLEVSSVVVKNCRCSRYRGQDLCKTFLNINCQKILMEQKNKKGSIKDWDSLRYKE